MPDGHPVPMRINFTDDQRARALAAAPGFTVADLDGLMREAYARGHDDGHAKGYDSGHRAGVQAGEADVRGAVRDAIERVVRGRLNHIERRLRRDRDKRTIAAERAYMANEADSLNLAITDLGRIA